VKRDALSEKGRAAIATAIVAAVDERKARTNAEVRKPVAIKPEARTVLLMPIAGRSGQDRRKERRVVQMPHGPRDQAKSARRRRSDQSAPNGKSGKSAAIDRSEVNVANARNVPIGRHDRKAPKSNKRKPEAAEDVDVASAVQIEPAAAMGHKMLVAVRQATVPPSHRGQGLSNLVQATTSSRANQKGRRSKPSKLRSLRSPR